jgi:hypothetical protein
MRITRRTPAGLGVLAAAELGKPSAQPGPGGGPAMNALLEAIENDRPIARDNVDELEPEWAG